MPGIGLRLARSQGMEGSTGNLHEFAIDPANTNPIFHGDLVALNGGYVEEATGAADSDDFDVLGVFAGCKFAEADGSFKWEHHWSGGAGRTNVMALVALPEGATWLIKGDDAGGYTQADVGTRKGVLYAAGDAMLGDSRITLGAAGATVATGPLMVHKMVDIPAGKMAPDETWFEVSVVRSQLFAQQ